MHVQSQVNNYISSLPPAKQTAIQTLHNILLQLAPKAKLWFLDGKDETGKIISNPNIGYGSYTIQYADGATREFYQVGLSANSTGISVYIMGIKDKEYLPGKYAASIGKATVTGYCIRFKKLDEVDMDILTAAMEDGIRISGQQQ